MLQLSYTLIIYRKKKKKQLPTMKVAASFLCLKIKERGKSYGMQEASASKAGKKEIYL